MTAPSPETAQARLDARKAQQTLEPIHAYVYFAPQPAVQYKAAGLKGSAMGYFASRAAALGPVGPDLVVATFYNFAPWLIARAIPDAWSFASPEAILAARYAGVGEMLAEPFAGIPAADVEEANGLLDEVVAVLDAPGRPLYAAHAGLPTPTDPVQRVWHQLALLREWRGDGHIAALLTAGVGPVEALVVHAASGGPDAAMLQASRGWSDEQWATARDGLIAAGELDADGAPTVQGREKKQAIEDTTDTLAEAPWLVLGPAKAKRLRELLQPAARVIVEGGGLSFMQAGIA